MPSLGPTHLFKSGDLLHLGASSLPWHHWLSSKMTTPALEVASGRTWQAAFSFHLSVYAGVDFSAALVHAYVRQSERF